MATGLYNPLLMATPTGGAVKNEKFNMLFRARCSYPSTHNVLLFQSNPESPIFDGPRMFTKIFGLANTQVSLIFPFKREFLAQIPVLMEGKIKKVKARLITSMPIATVSLYLWKSSARLVPGDRVGNRIFQFPVPTAPGDIFTFPGSGFTDIRLEQGFFYYWCFEFDDLIPRSTNFGIQLTTDIFWGNGPKV